MKLLIAAMLLAGSGCVSSPISSDVDTSTTPELTRPTLPSIPIDCLMNPRCKPNWAGSPLEIGSQRMVNVPTGTEQLRDVDESTQNSRRGFRRIFQKADEISATARKMALDAQDPEGRLKEQAAAVASEPRQLPERPPESLRMAQEYRRSEQFVDCLTSYYALTEGQKVNDVNENQKYELLQVLYTRYVSKCFSSAPKELLNRLAVFWTNWNAGKRDGALGIYCLGFALDRKYVVTAKHCLADPSTVQLIKAGKWPSSSVELHPLPGSRITFADDIRTSYTYHLSSLRGKSIGDRFDPNNVTDDLAVIELEKPRDLLLFPIDAHANWEHTLIFTVFMDFNDLRECSNGSPSVKCTERHLFRVDDKPSCVSPVRNDACLLHSCQTRPGSSGGPIIAVRPGGYTLIGIHTGAIDRPEQAPCDLPRGQYYQNYGLAIESSPVLKTLLNDLRGSE